jgi:outer membrane protein assembly factor BamA
VDESANNLRALGIFQRVSINPADSGVVEVVVKEHFSTEVFASLRREDGEIKSVVGFKENNLLGQGYILSLRASNREPRSRTRFLFINPRFLGTRFYNENNYTDFDEGTYNKFRFTRPFYSLETKWDLGFEYSRFKGIQKLYLPVDELNIRNEKKMFQSYFGKYFGKSLRIRAGASYTYIDETWSNPLAVSKPGEWKSRAVMFFIGGVRRDLSVRYNVDINDLEEDVHTGYLFNLGYGADIPDFGVKKAHRYFSLHLVLSRNFSDHENAFFEFIQKRALDGIRDIERNTNARLTAFSTRLPWQTLAAAVEFNGYDMPRPFQKVYLGENRGLRGYGSRSHTGDRRLNINIENRIMTNYELFIFRLGAALFIDSGKTWNAGSSFMDAPWFTSAGFGLRISSQKFPKAIFRMDLAYNFDAGKFSSVSISNGHFFRVLFPIEIGNPNFKDQIVY